MSTRFFSYVCWFLSVATMLASFSLWLTAIWARDPVAGHKLAMTGFVAFVVALIFGAVGGILLDE